MIRRAIDTQNDWVFGNGKQDYLSEENSLNQSIKTRLQSFVGDCYFDLSAGVDWFTFLGTKNQQALKNAIMKQIVTTTGVLSLDELNLTLDENRALLLQYSVTSIWGDTVTSTVLMG